MVLAAGAAGRLPAHFQTRVPLWVGPSRTLCSACPPQFLVSIKSPNSRSTSSRFLRLREGLKHLGSDCVIRERDGLVGGPLPKHGAVTWAHSVRQSAGPPCAAWFGRYHRKISSGGPGESENEARTMAHEDVFCGVDKSMTTTSFMIKDLRAWNLQVFVWQNWRTYQIVDQ